MADIMVEATQRYLNAMYGGDSRYQTIPESVYGRTGWTTIYALIRALQIELGIQNTADSFGPTTIAKFNERFPNGIQQQANNDTTTDRIYAIIQGACWCKGYSTGASGITEHFYDGTGGAIKQLKADAGIENTSSTVTLDVMKALLSMDQFVLVTNGNEKIRIIQQKLNNKYQDYIGLIPCDGLYGRQMNKAMIIALQKIEGYSKNEATGNFGNGTKANLPIISSENSSTQIQKEAIELIRYALCCNGYTDIEIIVNTWDDALEQKLGEFQEDMCIEKTYICDVNTWMSLLLSKGNPDRGCVACDTRFEMTDGVLRYLKNNGYQIVGRYLTGGDFKELRTGEPRRILNAGLKFFPIFQESGTDLTYFTYERGKQDAKNAVKAARKHGIQGDNIIYFAVDTDPTGEQISTYILPYFKGIYENISKSFEVGVYGTRNVCTQVMDLGYAETCFVSDMSTGYSGNMGFKMPDNWNLDQFSEISNIIIGNETIDLDKVAYSGEFPVVENVYKNILEFNNYIIQLEVLYRNYKSNCTTEELILGITNFLRSFKYGNVAWYVATLTPIDEGFINYVQNQNLDLYNKLAEYAATDEKTLIDGIGGYIDIGHLAATVEGYFENQIVDSYMLGWGGDLASLMKDVDTKSISGVREHLELAKTLIGDRSAFNYPDICTDADAIKIANMLQNASSNTSFSDIITTYYSGDYLNNRYEYYLLDLGLELTDNLAISEVKSAIRNKVEDNSMIIDIIGFFPTQDSIDACCEAFAQYIIDNL